MVAEVHSLGMEPATQTVSESNSYGHGAAMKMAAIRAKKLANRKKMAAGHSGDEPKKAVDVEDRSRDSMGKRKRYRHAPWLCENMSVKESTAIRSDVDDALASTIGEERHTVFASSNCLRIDESDDDYLDWLDMEVRCWTRHKRKHHLPPQVKYLADVVSFATKRKLNDVAQKFGKKTFIKSDVVARLKKRDGEMCNIRERTAANVSERLADRGLTRRNVLEPQQTTQGFSNTKMATEKLIYTRERKTRGRTRQRKPRWSHEQKEERDRVPHEFELRVDQVEKDDPEEAELMCFLLDLQNRDVTPEDYEMLLRLTESVQPKTVADDKLSSLRTVILSSEGASDVPWTGTQCVVCMEEYEEGQIVKFLPCEHFFHSECIERWLINEGNFCPLDLLEV